MKKELLKRLIDKNLFVAMLLIFIFCGCSGSKMNNNNNIEQLEMILIKDYSKTYKFELHNYTYFSISHYNSLEKNNLIIYNIRPERNKVILSPEGDGYYPKDYIEFKDKIFFIDGKITNQPSEKIYNFLKDRNLIDSAMYKVELGLVEYEDLKPGEGKITYYNSQKVTTYVVCETSNKIIKKWRTNKSETTAKNIEKAIKKGCKN
ncbi:hypothetical protein [Paenimyroides ceti]